MVGGPSSGHLPCTGDKALTQARAEGLRGPALLGLLKPLRKWHFLHQCHTAALWELSWSSIPLQGEQGAGDTPSVCHQEYCSWGGLCFHGYKPWELLGDGAVVYTDTDPHRTARKIATDLLSHWPHIFIVSGKGRPAYQRLIILQQPVNCRVFKHPFRCPRSLLE